MANCSISGFFSSTLSMTDALKDYLNGADLVQKADAISSAIGGFVGAIDALIANPFFKFAGAGPGGYDIAANIRNLYNLREEYNKKLQTGDPGAILAASIEYDEKLTEQITSLVGAIAGNIALYAPDPRLQLAAAALSIAVLAYKNRRAIEGVADTLHDALEPLRDLIQPEKNWCNENKINPAVKDAFNNARRSA